MVVAIRRCRGNQPCQGLLCRSPPIAAYSSSLQRRHHRSVAELLAGPIHHCDVSNIAVIMSSVLIVGASRGLGNELAKLYADKGHSVYATSRSEPPKEALQNVHWVSGVDIGKEDGGKTMCKGLNGQQLDVVIITAGFFPKESIDEPDFEAELQTYRTCAIGPVFIVQALYKADLLKKGSKIILVSSEAGSIGLRHESEGGGNYAHHASKAALNMVGKLLSIDLKEAGVAVAMVHPGFMRTEMTKNVGFDKFWVRKHNFTPIQARLNIRLIRSP